MFNTLTSWLRPSAARRRRSSRLAATPVRVEGLEDRAVPDATPYILTTGPYIQHWNNETSYTSDWTASEQASVQGFAGAGLQASTTGNAGTVLGTTTGEAPSLDLNLASDPPNTHGGSGAAVFYPAQIGDGTVALKPTINSSPYLLFTLNTQNVGDVFVNYTLRDIDGSASVTESVALQWRIGTTGNFTNALTTPDGTIGSNEPVTARLPAAVDGQSVVQVRIITTTPAVGGGPLGTNYQWIGVDDITIQGNVAPTVVPSAGASVYQEPT
ncbi:MAG TPA: hypothetical protein VH092_02805, partial [Urbifossiella sp.]|nr:hypothetical protein [Urbifossiella sp.]